MPSHYDLIVLGGGSAGYAAARTAASYNKSVAIVDGSKELGGLCILKGCMPSKTLIYSTEIAHLAQQSSLFGLDIPAVKVDMAALQKRKRDIIAGFAKYRKDQLESDRFTLYKQHGTFHDPHTIKLEDGTFISGEKTFIATGSIVNTPQIPGLKETHHIISDDVLNLKKLPESIIVLGGGVIACELAQFLHRAGSKVIQIQRSPHVLKDTSPEAASVIEQAFRDEGIKLYTDTHVTQIKQEENSVSITFDHKGQSITEKATTLFNALGRKPNTSSLDIEKAGIELLKTGHIKTNEFQQTSQKHIYAGGDCAGPHEIVHIAVMQGETGSQHAFNKSSRPINYNHLSKIIFTDPQVASVGLHETELQKNNIDYIAADYPFNDHGKSILMNATYGYVKVMAAPITGKILGAECVSKDASELIHSMIVALPLDATVFDLLKAHWYHPTLAEIWTYPLEEIADKINPNS